MPALHVLSRGSMMINPFLKTESYQALQQALTAGVGPLAVTARISRPATSRICADRLLP